MWFPFFICLWNCFPIICITKNTIAISFWKWFDSFCHFYRIIRNLSRRHTISFLRHRWAFCFNRDGFAYFGLGTSLSSLSGSDLQFVRLRRFRGKNKTLSLISRLLFAEISLAARRRGIIPSSKMILFWTERTGPSSKLR